MNLLQNFQALESTSSAIKPCCDDVTRANKYWIPVKMELICNQLASWFFIPANINTFDQNKNNWQRGRNLLVKNYGKDPCWLLKFLLILDIKPENINVIFLCKFSNEKLFEWNENMKQNLKLFMRNYLTHFKKRKIKKKAHTFHRHF